MKRVLSIVLCFALMTSMSINVFAFPNVNHENVSRQSNDELTNLWLNGKENFELISVSEDNRYFTTRFTINSVEYEIEESVNEDYDFIESDFYKINGSEKEYIGNQTTRLVQDGNNLTVSTSENGSLIDVGTFDMPSKDSTLNYLAATLKESITPYATIETKWFSQGKVNGSNNIQRYTVAAIVTLLGVAAGSSLAAGLSSIASSIILENWERVYWTRETWVYMERCSDWPSYPDWVLGGKYEYYTEYYSDSARTNMIGTSSYIDG